MKLRFALMTVLLSIIGASAKDEMPIGSSREKIRIVHQDISKWDKNGDGKLTGSERDAFVAVKRKEMADAAAAAQAAKGKTPLPVRFKPVMNPEDAQKPTPKGVPKNLEDAVSARSQ